ncbi:MAG TPA: AbrB/MazE/SpoVT family DNA-binding domain-containing protein [Candidatus Sulfotelmatobacter sp.]|jgi:AbrB family looped-hinge helix DNA binding protein|nr:AbrB/MazE/SpoVT family DNA-binding domain-containing protein [Candidatus Sulfotelmatobacter sp.]
MATTKSAVLAAEVRLKLNENGRVVIPVEFRRALGVDAGDEVILTWKDDEVRITTMQRRIERAQRHARQHIKPSISVVDEFIAGRRETAKRELD